MSGLVDRSGHIQLDWTVGSIQIGQRHRRDIGDLSELIDSIRDLGMLQPITVSPDGTLICGARRLAAAKQLGLRTINVWVRSGISTQLEKLLAESHDNTVRKPFSPSEAARMYQELKSLMAEDAARRQQATQFGGDIGAVCGAAESAAPPDRTSRAKAARLVTGQKSYTRLEQILELKQLVEDHQIPDAVRERARAALKHIDRDGTVNGHYQQVKSARALAAANRHEQATSTSTATPTGTHQPRSREDDQAEKPTTRPRYAVRAFLLGLGELSGWTTRHDPHKIGPALTAEEWTDFESTVTATVAFGDAARLARNC